MPAEITLDVVRKTFCGFGRPKHEADHSPQANVVFFKGR